MACTVVCIIDAEAYGIKKPAVLQVFLICLKLVWKFARNGRSYGAAGGSGHPALRGQGLGAAHLAKRLRLGPGVFGEQDLCERNIGRVEEIEEV